MRLGVESVGRWGLVLLTVTGALGVVLAIHGWSARSAGLPHGTLGTGRPSVPRTTSTPSRPPAGPTAPPSAAPSQNGHRPLLSSQPYASAAYLIWPGTPNGDAKAALAGLKVSVTKRGSDLLVTAGVVGQPAQPARRYAGAARVYVIEATFGDDSGNTDYNLGDDAIVVTDAKGGIIQ